MCAKNNCIYPWREQAIVRDCDVCSLVLLAATVPTFAHMPLGIFDRNNSKTLRTFKLLSSYFIQTQHSTSIQPSTSNRKKFTNYQGTLDETS